MKEEFRSTWELYAKAWTAVSTVERQHLLEQSVGSDCIYSDPLVQCRGLGELIAYIEQFQQGLPGGAFSTQEFDEHHDQALATWNMVDARGTVLNPGTSFVRFDESRRLAQMTGFFSVPKAEP